MTSLILLGCAVLMAAHAISTANFMSRTAPTSIALEVVVMFGFSVGSIISGYNRNPDDAMVFLGVALGSKLLLMVDLVLRGYPIGWSLLTCDFDRRNEYSFLLPRRRVTDHTDEHVIH